MKDNDYVLFVPLSTVLIIFFASLFVGLSIIYSIKSWFEENFITIVIVAGIVALAIAIFLWCKKGFSVALSSLFAFSQVLFFTVFGGMNLYEGESFALIWSTIVFAIYASIAIADILLYLYVSMLCIVDDDEDSFFFYLVLGGGGWLLDLIVLWLVLT